MHEGLGEYLAELVHNSVQAGAAVVSLELTERDQRVVLTVTDDGKGMDQATLARALDPFYTEAGKHPSRRVGLGLSFLKQLCEATGGTIEVDSTPGRGTRVHADYPAAHADAPPVDGLVAGLAMLFGYEGDYELQLRRAVGDETYEVSRRELAEAVGGLHTVEGQTLLREFLESNEAELRTAATR